MYTYFWPCRVRPNVQTMSEFNNIDGFNPYKNNKIHFIDKSMWKPARPTSHTKIMGINMELVPPFAAITASTLLGRLSTRCWNTVTGICFHSATRAFLRSGTDVAQLGLARSQCSNSSQRCWMGLRSGLCAGQSSSSTPI